MRVRDTHRDDGAREVHDEQYASGRAQAPSREYAGNEEENRESVGEVTHSAERAAEGTVHHAVEQAGRPVVGQFEIIARFSAPHSGHLSGVARTS